MAYAPTLTPFIDDNPGPRIFVQFTSLSPGTQTINVYKTIEGRQYQVRGGVNLYAVGGAAVMDYETPAATITYQAEQFDINGGSLGFTDTDSASLYFTESYFSQPLSPNLTVKGRIQLDSVNDLVRPTPGSVVFTEGATVGRMIGGRRQGLVGTQINVRLSSTEDCDTFEQMFGDYNTDFPAVLCIRTAAPLRLPRLLFAACPEPHLVTSGINALMVYRMTITEVQPPSPGLVIPTLRRIDIDAAYPTRAARAAAYATRIARDTDFSLAGLAG